MFLSSFFFKFFILSRSYIYRSKKLDNFKKRDYNEEDNQQKTTFMCTAILCSYLIVWGIPAIIVTVNSALSNNELTDQEFDALYASNENGDGNE